jgi:glycogen synthase
MARIVLINYEYPPLGGGAANATANIARALVAQGRPALVITSAFAGLPAQEIDDYGVEIRRLPSLRRRADRSGVVEMSAFLLSSLLFAPWIVRRWRADGVIAFFGVPGGPSAWLTKILFGTPYVVSLRGGDVPGFRYDGIELFHRLAGPVIGFVWRRAKAVVANSDGLADLARRFAPDVAVPVVHNGVDVGLFSPAPPDSTASASPPPLRLLIVGRLVRQKGVDVILDAMARTPAASTLRVVGDGPERPALERQTAALGLSDRVAFDGWLPRARLPDAYRAADVFVFPSRDEGMPNVVLEAMASALPVIGTPIPGTRDLVADGENGLMIPPDAPDALDHALRRLADAPDLRRRMGEAGRRRAENLFSWGAAADAYAAWFEDRTAG